MISRMRYHLPKRLTISRSAPTTTASGSRGWCRNSRLSPLARWIVAAIAAIPPGLAVVPSALALTSCGHGGGKPAPKSFDQQLDQRLGDLNNQALETRWAANPAVSNNLVWYVHFQTRPTLDFYQGVRGLIAQNLLADAGGNYRHAGDWYAAVELFLWERLANRDLPVPKISGTGALPDPRVLALEADFLQKSLLAQERLLRGYHDFNPREPFFVREWTANELGELRLDPSGRVVLQTGATGFAALLHRCFFETRW